MALIKHGNNALSSVTAFPSAVPTGKLKLLSTATASSSSSIEFTSGIDSTYDIYKFEFNSIHPSAIAQFRFNLSTDGGSNYNVTKTTTAFEATHNEADGQTNLTYNANRDLAQSTSDQVFSDTIDTDNDSSLSGKLYLFQPSSTTYVKHFISTINFVKDAPQFSMNYFIAGYGNTTSAINAIIFRMSSGNIDAGTIKMYGISA